MKFILNCVILNIWIITTMGIVCCSSTTVDVGFFPHLHSESFHQNKNADSFTQSKGFKRKLSFEENNQFLKQTDSSNFAKIGNEDAQTLPANQLKNLFSIENTDGMFLSFIDDEPKDNYSSLLVNKSDENMVILDFMKFDNENELRGHKVTDDRKIKEVFNSRFEQPTLEIETQKTFDYNVGQKYHCSGTDYDYVQDMNEGTILEHLSYDGEINSYTMTFSHKNIITHELSKLHYNEPTIFEEMESFRYKEFIDNENCDANQENMEETANFCVDALDPNKHSIEFMRMQELNHKGDDAFICNDYNQNCVFNESVINAHLFTLDNSIKSAIDVNDDILASMPGAQEDENTLDLQNLYFEFITLNEENTIVNKEENNVYFSINFETNPVKETAFPESSIQCPMIIEEPNINTDFEVKYKHKSIDDIETNTNISNEKKNKNKYKKIFCNIIFRATDQLLYKILKTCEKDNDFMHSSMYTLRKISLIYENNKLHFFNLNHSESIHISNSDQQDSANDTINNFKHVEVAKKQKISNEDHQYNNYDTFIESFVNTEVKDNKNTIDSLFNVSGKSLPQKLVFLTKDQLKKLHKKLYDDVNLWNNLIFGKCIFSSETAPFIEKVLNSYKNLTENTLYKLNSEIINHCANKKNIHKRRRKKIIKKSIQYTINIIIPSFRITDETQNNIKEIVLQNHCTLSFNIRLLKDTNIENEAYSSYTNFHSKLIEYITHSRNLALDKSLLTCIFQRIHIDNIETCAEEYKKKFSLQPEKKFRRFCYNFYSNNLNIDNANIARSEYNLSFNIFRDKNNEQNKMILVKIENILIQIKFLLDNGIINYSIYYAIIHQEFANVMADDIFMDEPAEGLFNLLYSILETKETNIYIILPGFVFLTNCIKIDTFQPKIIETNEICMYLSMLHVFKLLVEFNWNKDVYGNLKAICLNSCDEHLLRLHNYISYVYGVVHILSFLLIPYAEVTLIKNILFVAEIEKVYHYFLRTTSSDKKLFIRSFKFQPVRYHFASLLFLTKNYFLKDHISINDSDKDKSLLYIFYSQHWYKSQFVVRSLTNKRLLSTTALLYLYLTTLTLYNITSELKNKIFVFLNDSESYNTIYDKLISFENTANNTECKNDVVINTYRTNLKKCFNMFLDVSDDIFLDLLKLRN